MHRIHAFSYSFAASIRVSGEDAADFLQSQFTNELRPFEAGRCTYGLWLDVKGKVLADSFLLCETGGAEPAFFACSINSPAKVIVDALERHIVADDVVIEPLPETYGIRLWGADAGSAVEALGLALPEAGRFTEADGVKVFRGHVFELCTESKAERDALQGRLSEMESVEFVEAERWHLERMGAEIPSIPAEIGPTDLPGEGGLEVDAISFTKGCYIGQEVVARMHHVGRPQRALWLIEGAGAPPVCPLALYNSDGKNVGELRSAYASGSEDPEWRGVALLKSRHATPGGVLKHETTQVNLLRPFRKARKGGVQ